MFTQGPSRDPRHTVISSFRYRSFRHGVTTKLYEAGVSEAVVDELTGHEGTGTSRTVYNKGFPLAVLRDAIAKVEWPKVDGALIER